MEIKEGKKKTRMKQRNDKAKERAKGNKEDK